MDDIPPPEIPAELIWELDAGLAAVEEEQAAMRRFDAALAKFATELAFREFPALRLMNAEQIRIFGDRIWRHVPSLSLELSNLAAAAEKNTGN